MTQGETKTFSVGKDDYEIVRKEGSGDLTKAAVAAAIELLELGFSPNRISISISSGYVVANCSVRKAPEKKVYDITYKKKSPLVATSWEASSEEEIKATFERRYPDYEVIEVIEK